MRDSIPPSESASKQSEGDPSPEDTATLAVPSQASASVSAAGAAGAAELLSAPAAADSGEPAETTDPRGIFGLRRALKSAVRVLRKERTLSIATDSSVDAVSVDAICVAPERASAPAAAAEEPRPAGLSGHTSAVAIPELLGFLAQLRKSGTLWIWNEREQFRIQLVDGHVKFARDETPGRGWLLGEVLISQGAMEAKRFDAFIKQRTDKGPLGDALVQAGLIDKQALTIAVQFQAQRVFNRAFGLSNAWFCLDSESSEKVSEIKISVTQMLFESARARDESEQRLSSVFNDPYAAK